MRVLRFGLGVRFYIDENDNKQTAQIWEEVFSVLTASDVKGMHIYGGYMTYASDDVSYICAFTNGGLRDMRRVYEKLRNDAGVAMYLTAAHPFIQTNALEKLEDFTFYGKVESDGSLSGGETGFPLIIPTKGGRTRPRGKGIAFLIAPCGCARGGLNPKYAAKRLTIAARKHFKGVRVVPLPILDGGTGTVDAVLTAYSGIKRVAQPKQPNSEAAYAYYAVLRGNSGLIEMPAIYEGQAESEGEYVSSYIIGETICRALDEGLTEIIVSCSKSVINDYGMGCMAALGVRFLNDNGEELKCVEGDILKVASIDTTGIHSRLTKTSFVVMTDDVRKLSIDEGGVESFFNMLELETGVGVFNRLGSAAAGGLAGALMSLCGAKRYSCVQAIDSFIRLERLIEHISLVVTSVGEFNAQCMAAEHPAGYLFKLANDNNTPIVVLAENVEVEEEKLLGFNVFEIGAATDGEILKRYDNAADSMFRMLMLGSEIERISEKKLRRGTNRGRK